MKKCNEVINEWKNYCENPFKIVFNIQIDTEDFNEMIREIEEMKKENELMKKFMEKVI